jgi:predicted nucleotidyltransferase
MATTIAKDFKEFLKLLEEKSVEYLVVGGYAVAYHGYPRATIDFDIWVRPTIENARRVYKALEEFGFPTGGMGETTFATQGVGARMGVPPMRLELITFADGLVFEAAYANRVRARMDEIDVNLISLDDLKLNKKTVGRNKDLADLDHLPGGSLDTKRKTKKT